MKLIIIFVLLVSALSHRSVEGLVSSFNQTLGKNNSLPMVQHASECMNNLVAQLQKIKPDLLDDETVFVSPFARGVALFDELQPMVEAACRLFIQDLDTYVTSYGNEEELLSYFETNSDNFLEQLVDFYASLQQQNLTETSLAYELFNQTLNSLISTRTIIEQERYSSEEGEESEEEDDEEGDENEDNEEHDDSEEDEEIEETEESENEEEIEETEGPEPELEEYYQDGGLEEADEVDEDDDSEETIDPSEEDDYEYEEWGRRRIIRPHSRPGEYHSATVHYSSQ